MAASEQECTATENARGERPNPLFVPDCACAACSAREAAALAEADRRTSTTWLRASGNRQRLAVENIQLSERGRAALG